MDTPINRKILAATKDDTSRTDYQKLFENRCSTIAKHIGFDDTPSEQARKFSCDVPGVGIALYAGRDLGKHSPEKVGKYFVDQLAAKGLKAKVFIEHEYPHGTSMGFYINGAVWLGEPLGPLQAIEKIDFLEAETKLILFTDKRVSEWQYRPK